MNGSIWQESEDFRASINIINSKDRGQFWTMVTVNYPTELYYRATSYKYWVSTGYYLVSLQKTSIVKLPEPYSDCLESTTDDESLNVFKGGYTAYKCLETCLLKKMAMQCGQFSFQFKHYVPDSWYKKRNGNGTSGMDNTFGHC